MATFQYKAFDGAGSEVSGDIDSDTLETANTALTARGLIPLEVKEKKAKGEGFGWTALDRLVTGIKVPELILFTKQMSTMFKAGVPILRLFEVLEDQTENSRLKFVIGKIKQDIEEGSTLHAAFAKHPSAFSPLYCAMIEAGELGGTLPDVLNRLIYIIEHEYKIKSELKSAMTYPAIVVVTLVIAFFILLTFVVPKFVTVFVKAGIDIPLPTMIAMVMYEFVDKYWYLLLGGFIGFVIAFIAYGRTENGKYVRDNLFIHLPLIGPLFIKSAMSRFASIYAILQASGVPVLEIMQMLSHVIGNAAIARQFDKLQDQLREGKGIASPLRSAKYFTPMVINMVAIGEESGNLDEMLTAISEHYDAEVSYATERLAAAIGPILVVGLSAVVGFFALAIYLPMWDLTKMVK